MIGAACSAQQTVNLCNHGQRRSSTSPLAGQRCFCWLRLFLVSHQVYTRQNSRLLHLVLPPLLPHLIVLHCQPQSLVAQHMQLLRLQPQDVALTLCSGCELVLADHHLPNEVCWTQQRYLLKSA